MNTPQEIAELYMMVGDGKTSRMVWVQFVLGCFAGAFIALGGLASQILSCGMVPVALGRFLSAIIFPIGLMMVIIAGGELFTGNCLISICVFSKNTYVSAMLRNWIIVYLGNMAGGIFISLLVAYGGVLDMYNGELANLAVSMAVQKCTIPFIPALFKGIMCNFLVCIAVWVSFSTEEVVGKILSLYLPIALFIACGFEHCVANMYFIPTGIFANSIYEMNASGLTWLNMFWKNLLPVTLGNIFGGAVLVGGGYWLIFLSHHDED